MACVILYVMTSYHVLYPCMIVEEDEEYVHKAMKKKKKIQRSISELNLYFPPCKDVSLGLVFKS